MTNMLITITTGVATGLILISITAMINIKIKYAQSAAHATRAVALIFWKIIYGCSLVFVALILYKELTSSEPLTRSSLITILMSSFCLFQAVIFYFFMRIYKAFENYNILFENEGTISQAMINIIKNLPCKTDIATPKEKPTA